MVSHVDDDHIQGILELTKELRERQRNSAVAAARRSLWHNSFDDLIGNKPEELTASSAAQFGCGLDRRRCAGDAQVEVGEIDVEERGRSQTR